MKQIIVAIKDRAAEAFMRPWFVPTVGMAVRSFIDEVNRAADDNNLYRHPDDFELYEIGVYDDSTGRIESYDDMHLLMMAKQVKE